MEFLLHTSRTRFRPYVRLNAVLLTFFTKICILWIEMRIQMLRIWAMAKVEFCDGVIIVAVEVEVIIIVSIVFSGLLFSRQPCAPSAWSSAYRLGDVVYLHTFDLIPSVCFF